MSWMVLMLVGAHAADLRAVVANGDVIACWDGASAVSSDACAAGSARAVSVAPLHSEAKVHSWVVMLTPVSDGRPCPSNKQASPASAEGDVVARRNVFPQPPGGMYQTLIGEAIGVAKPEIKQLIKIDLEGDGVDEILFAVGGTEPDGSAYAVCGARKVVGGRNAVTVIGLDKRTADDACALDGVTDLDGDGKLEVVVSHTFPRGNATHVMRVDADKMPSLGKAECGG